MSLIPFDSMTFENLLLAINNSIESLPLWSVIFITAMFAALAWILISQIYSLLHTRRLIQDTPTSKIRSASQGQVEFIGIAENVPTFELISPLSNTACAWYAFSIEREVIRQDGKPYWEMLKAGSSDDLFLIRDETGICVVAPLGAQVTTNKNVRWISDELPVHLQTNNTPSKGQVRYRFFEAKIEIGDPVYIMGYFETTRILQKSYESEERIHPKNQAYASKKPRLRHPSIPVTGHVNHTFQQWNQIKEQKLIPEITEETINIIHYQKYLRLPYMISNYSEKKLTRYYLMQAILYIVFLTLSLWLPLWILDLKYL